MFALATEAASPPSPATVSGVDIPLVGFDCGFGSGLPRSTEIEVRCRFVGGGVISLNWYVGGVNCSTRVRSEAVDENGEVWNEESTSKPGAK